MAARTCARTAANDIPRGSARSSCTCTPAPPWPSPPGVAAGAGSCRLRRSRSRSRTPLLRRAEVDWEAEAEAEAEPQAEEASPDASDEEGSAGGGWMQPVSISAGQGARRATVLEGGPPTPTAVVSRSAAASSRARVRE